MFVTTFVTITALSFTTFSVSANSNINDEESYKEMSQLFPFALLSHDDEGTPVWLMEFGKWDFRPVLDNDPDGFDKLDKYTDRIMWDFIYDAKNSSTGSAYVIVDLDGYVLSKLAHVECNKLIRILYRTKIANGKTGKIEDGVVKGVIGINVNAVFLQGFALGKPLLGKLSEVVELYGTNPGKWKPRLARVISREHLPEYLGGTNKDFKPVKIIGK